MIKCTLRVCRKRGKGTCTETGVSIINKLCKGGADTGRGEGNIIESYLRLAHTCIYKSVIVIMFFDILRQSWILEELTVKLKTF